jgi:hypothetical protein
MAVLDLGSYSLPGTYALRVEKTSSRLSLLSESSSYDKFRVCCMSREEKRILGCRSLEREFPTRLYIYIQRLLMTTVPPVFIVL